MNALGRMGGETRLHHATQLKELIVSTISKLSEATHSWVVQWDRKQRLRTIVAALAKMNPTDVDERYRLPWKRLVATARLELAAQAKDERRQRTDQQP